MPKQPLSRETEYYIEQRRKEERREKRDEERRERQDEWDESRKAERQRISALIERRKEIRDALKLHKMDFDDLVTTTHLLYDMEHAKLRGKSLGAFQRGETPPNDRELHSRAMDAVNNHVTSLLNFKDELRKLNSVHADRRSFMWYVSHVLEPGRPWKAKETYETLDGLLAANELYNKNPDYYGKRRQYAESAVKAELEGDGKKPVAGLTTFAHCLYDGLLRQSFRRVPADKWTPIIKDEADITDPEHEAREQFLKWLGELKDSYGHVEQDFEGKRFEWFEPFAARIGDITGLNEGGVRAVIGRYGDLYYNDERRRTDYVSQAVAHNSLRMRGLESIPELHEIASKVFKSIHDRVRSREKGQEHKSYTLAKLRFEEKFMAPLSTAAAAEELRSKHSSAPEDKRFDELLAHVDAKVNMAPFKSVKSMVEEEMNRREAPKPEKKEETPEERETREKEERRKQKRGQIGLDDF